MKKLNKKGFTIVELVIVIAVIAILAAVLIPTFSNVVEKANDSARLQKARNAFVQWSSEEKDGKLNAERSGKVIGVKITEGNETYWFTVTDGSVAASTDEVKAEKDSDRNIIITVDGDNKIDEGSAPTN